MSQPTTSSPARARDRDRALHLEYASLLWAFTEAVVGLAMAIAARSVALLGFGIDSLIETSSAGVMIWRLLAERRAADPEAVSRLDRRAHQLIALSFYGLSLYIALDAGLTLWRGERPHPTVAGTAFTASTIGVMYWLWAAKRRAARALGSPALEADSFQASACMWLAVTSLAGVGLNAALGWWWADPAAALIMPAFLVQEARKAWAR